jgi:HSP20 family molecular chaperone IbpA
MQRLEYELMHDQVRAIYRALTGAPLPERDVHPTGPQLPPNVEDLEIVTRRFAELESWARAIPPVAERVPPFAFTPALDVIEDDKELRIEAAVPGVTREEVRVELSGDHLTLSGIRQGVRAANGRIFRHAEIPRGPFHRAVTVPRELTAGTPRVEVQNGVVVIVLAKLPMGSAAKA